jgi:hypothetical protein
VEESLVLEEDEELGDTANVKENGSEDLDEDSHSDDTKFDPDYVASGAVHPPPSDTLSSKSFQCTFCPKEFLRQDHLSRHMSVHTSPKSLSCHLCPKGFSRKDKLKHHLLREHAIEKQAEGEEGEEGDVSVAAREVDVKVEIVEREIKQEPGESAATNDAVGKTSKEGKSPEKKCAKKKKAVGRPAKKSAKTKNDSNGVGVKKKVSYVCKYCKGGFTSVGKRKQHILDSHWSELNDKGLLFTHNNALRQGSLA